ncbi:MAG: ammonium transporter [Gemmataceae bacterium]
MFGALRAFVLVALLLGFFSATMPAVWGQAPPGPADADPAKTPAMMKDVADAKSAAAAADTNAHKYSDIVWILISTALVMLMMPGLALFYGGMARRKNVLGTMMHTMVALGLVGVQWVVIGYALAFGPSYVKIPAVEALGASEGGFVGFDSKLVMLSETAAIPVKEAAIYKEMKLDPEKATDKQKEEVAKTLTQRNKYNVFPNTKLPLYLHAMFQGMFAIITVALVSGAFAERVKFSAYLLFSLLWTTLVYDPLAHCVWSFSWEMPADAKPGDLFAASGFLGANGAIDFAGGTVVHIAAGFSGLAAVLVLRKRLGYGQQVFHPNSMVLTLLGAGLLWFGWFGFNGGSALMSNPQAVSAFTVTQIAAAAASLAWILVEWLHRGKPTALGFASGLVAGLVAITPASGFVPPSGALAIGLIAGVVCYWAVAAKGMLGYDDSLDAFGIHGVGGFLGAVLTGVFVSLPLWCYGAEFEEKYFPGKLNEAKTAIDYFAQIKWQVIASVASVLYAFFATIILVLLIDKTIGFTLKPKDEAAGLDLSQHGEVGFDMGPDVDAGAVVEPKSAAAPPSAGMARRFTVVVEGVAEPVLMGAWSKLCQAGTTPPSKEFAAVYPYLTTVSGNRFRFRGGDPVVLKEQLKKLFENALGGAAVKTHVE